MARTSFTARLICSAVAAAIALPCFASEVEDGFGTPRDGRFAGSKPAGGGR
jgi:hypothetical protein